MAKRSNRRQKQNRDNFIPPLKQYLYPRELRLPNPLYISNIYNEEQLEEWSANLIKFQLLTVQKQAASVVQQKDEEREKSIGDLFYLLTNIVTGVWKTHQRLIAMGADQLSSENRKLFRTIDSTLQTIKQSGVEVIDRTNEPYVNGMTEKVLTFQPIPELEKETIIETLKPSILYKGQIIQYGEIIVGQPKL
jgi:hypothetical protein